jgi:hypothetical protein
VKVKFFPVIVGSVVVVLYHDSDSKGKLIGLVALPRDFVWALLEVVSLVVTITTLDL